MKKDKNIKTIAIVGLLVICMTCLTVSYVYNHPKRELEKQVKAMTGSNLNLTFEQAKAYFNGVDSTYISLPKKKLVVFVDSTSCSGCFLSHLNEYFEINDTLQIRHAELVIVLHPQHARLYEVSSCLRQEKFPFWCILDSDGEFIRNNSDIPSNQKLHSFLLDEEDVIALVGNPSRNNKIKELFYKTLQHMHSHEGGLSSNRHKQNGTLGQIPLPVKSGSLATTLKTNSLSQT